MEANQTRLARRLSTRSGDRRNRSFIPPRPRRPPDALKREEWTRRPTRPESTPCRDPSASRREPSIDGRVPSQALMNPSSAGVVPAAPQGQRLRNHRFPVPTPPGAGDRLPARGPCFGQEFHPARRRPTRPSSHPAGPAIPGHYPSTPGVLDSTRGGRPTGRLRRCWRWPLRKSKRHPSEQERKFRWHFLQKGKERQQAMQFAR